MNGPTLKGWTVLHAVSNVIPGDFGRQARSVLTERFKRWYDQLDSSLSGESRFFKGSD
jgi:hypothetical protein